MTLYLLLLIKSFKLEIRFINIQQDTLTFTDLIAVACDQTIFKGQTRYNLNTLTPYIHIFL